MTDGAQRGLTAMEAKRLPLRSKRNWNPNRKSQNYFELQIWKPISIFDENRKPSAKTRKSAKHNRHQNCETEVCSVQNWKTDLTPTNTANPKILIPLPYWYYSSTEELLREDHAKWLQIAKRGLTSFTEAQCYLCIERLHFDCPYFPGITCVKSWALPCRVSNFERWKNCVHPPFQSLSNL